MNAFDFAMQMERDGERYYRELSEKTDNGGVRNILVMLADAEIAHYHLFRDMREGTPVQTSESAILDDVKNIFAEMKAQGSSQADPGQTDLYRKALEIEKKSRDFYLAQAEETPEEERKEIFRKIAAEEGKHYRIVENILDFISRPEQWLEDAEWYHLDEY